MARNSSHLVDLGTLSPAWLGWVLNTKTGDLHPPDGDRPHRPDTLGGLHWHHQVLAADRAELRQEIARLNARIEQLRIHRIRVAVDSRPRSPRRTYCIKGRAGGSDSVRGFGNPFGME